MTPGFIVLRHRLDVGTTSADHLKFGEACNYRFLKNVFFCDFQNENEIF